MECNKLCHIIIKIRLPQIMTAVITGACLGLADALIQIILNNPLASPFTLDISAHLPSEQHW
ncbi:iron chelate uptake ABC transporter family permease subunit [Treponema socranskii]|uniref:iron chelate uptake ABC transporter family permease subunit n=1 Tax=Treponema socranskii TaxID=53419 RepID=UPI0036F37D83